MDNFINSTTDKIHKSMIGGFKLGVINGTLEKYQNGSNVEKFKNVMEKLTQLEQDFTNENQLIKEIQCESVDEFDKKYKAAMIKVQKSRTNSRDSNRYKDFMKDLEDIQYVASQNLNGTQIEGTQAASSSAPDDECAVQNQEFEVPIDPISKNPISEPVRNRVCKHVYDKYTIEESCKLNNNLRCPYMGCGNKRINLNDLEPDRDLKRKIMQVQTQEESMMETEY